MFGARNFFLTAARAAFDPLFDYVTLLLTGNGTNGAQNNTFLDSSTNNFAITRNGNTTQGTFTPFGPNWSNYFDGTGDSLVISSGNVAQFGTGDFTMEAWVYLLSHDGDESAVMTGGINFGIYTQPNVNIATNGTVNLNGAQSTSNTVPLNTWTHIAVSRNSGTSRIFINGVQGSSASNTSNYNGVGAMIGIRSNGSSDFGSIHGYISNVRYVNGTGLYSSAFTPSTAPLTAITNTSLLTCQSNRFIDNSSNNFTITRNGDVSVQRFSPFNPTVPYAAGTIGGSGYFDAVNDTLTTATSANLNVGTGAFQIDFWMYTTASPGQYMGPFGTNNAGGTGGIFFANRGGNLDFTNNFDTAGAISGPFPRLNEWHHIVVVRNSSNVRAYYVDGVRVGALSNAVDFNQTQFTIGAYNASFGGWTGYISNFRVIVGSNIVDPNSTTIAVPTSPTTAVAGTQLLLNFINGGIIDNAMMNDLETVGNAQISTSVSKFGGGSLAFDGNGDWLQIPNSQNFNFGSGNFTVEGWVYCTNTTPLQDIFTTPANGPGFNGLTFSINNGNFVITSCWATGSWQILFASAGAVVTNTWYHFAVVRNGGTLTVYVNGTSTYSNNTLGTSSLVFGTDPATISYGRVNQSDARYFYGYIDDLRITKAARYTANFTPPAAPFSLQ